MFRRITKRDRPEAIESATRFHERRLLRAVEVATRRASRSSSTIQALFASAKVTGRADSDIKAAIVSFEAPPFSGGLHHFYPWEYLDSFSQSELAIEISQVLRNAVSRKLKGGK